MIRWVTRNISLCGRKTPAKMAHVSMPLDVFLCTLVMNLSNISPSISSLRREPSSTVAGPGRWLVKRGKADEGDGLTYLAPDTLPIAGETAAGDEDFFTCVGDDAAAVAAEVETEPDDLTYLGGRSIRVSPPDDFDENEVGDGDEAGEMEEEGIGTALVG